MCHRARHSAQRWLILIMFARARFATGASAAVMAVARRFGFSTQGLELVPGLEFFPVESRSVAFFAIEQHHDFIAHRQHVNDLAFTFRSDNPLVPFGELLASFHILLIFVNKTTAQASAHAG